MRICVARRVPNQTDIARTGDMNYVRSERPQRFSHFSRVPPEQNVKNEVPLNRNRQPAAPQWQSERMFVFGMSSIVGAVHGKKGKIVFSGERDEMATGESGAVDFVKIVR